MYRKCGDSSVFRSFVVAKHVSTTLLSRGMLSVWASVCEGASVTDILAQDPNRMADVWGLRLSPGRNDGLASMVRTTQTILRELLKQHQQQPSEGDTTTDNLVSSLTGVDSSVALHLLLQQGYDVTCFYLKIWLEDEVAYLGECPWEADVQMCRTVCEHAGNVPLEIISLQREYQERVISYTMHEAQQGRTPNPDIMCNARIKFGCFYDALAKLEEEEDGNRRTFDFVATGHYAQLVRNHKDDDDVVQLVRAPDPVKDQSYFLCALTQDQLRRVLFPIGHLQKSQVRQVALDLELPNRHRPDSKGLCFLGKVKFSDFLKAYLGESPGNIVDAATGELLGRHKGLWFHTVGQRKGIGTSLNPLATARGPWYVVAKDPPANIVYCSNQYDGEMFEQPRSEFTIENISWIAGRAPAMNESLVLRLDFKIRHGPRLVKGLLHVLVNEHESNHHEYQQQEGRVYLHVKDGGLAPGQYVVFYRPETAECLGGGVISERHWAQFLFQREKQQEQLQLNTTMTAVA